MDGELFLFMEKKGGALTYFVGIIVVAVVVYVLHIGASVLIPLFLATFLAYLTEPLYVLLNDRFRLYRWLTIVIILIVLVGIFVGLNNILIANIKQFIVSSDVYVQGLTAQIQGLIGYARENNINIGLEQILGQVDLKETVQFSVNLVLKLASSTLFILLFVVFILAERDVFGHKIEELSRRVGMRSGIKSIIRNINRQVEHYIVWKTIISLSTGLASLIVFLISGIDAPFLWAFLIFIFNYIPTIGSIIASIFPITMILVQTGSPGSAFLMLLAMLVIQVTHGNIVEPRLMGNKLNLSPLVVLLSLLFWNQIWGVAGMFLAIPIMATLNIIMANIPGVSHISLLISNRPKRKSRSGDL